MRKRIYTRLTIFTLCLAVMACSPSPESAKDQAPDKPEFSVDYQKFTLDNGLEVVLHQDFSDPVVAVALTVHVGSAREKPQRTGFAHLFEHLLFLESENLGKGGLDKLSARIGGSGANGSTSRDRTNYFQTVPKDALEKMIWAEADKLGWFINTVTEPVLAKEKQVVKNEKRQRVDNQPYGHTGYVVDKLLYPEDHPYNWQVIGSLEDLQAATLADVKEFFNTWYVPNNTTLVIAGDFDVEQTKTWVKKYFDEIPRGSEIPELVKRPGKVEEITRVYHEDNFARLPELSMVWPAVETYHPDTYALQVLAVYLANDKQAPFYLELIKNKQLTSNVRMYNRVSEIAGQFHVSVRAFEDVPLDSVAEAINEAFKQFEASGISESSLDRIKAQQETRFYQSLSSVLGKGFQLAQYNIFANDPGFVAQDIANILAVTPDDVMRVYNTYIKDKNYIATSFVPKGQADLALTGSDVAKVTEEQIVAGAEDAIDLNQYVDYEPTPSSFDRSKEPEYSEAVKVTIPTVWQNELESGFGIWGIENTEVPLVEARIAIEGGLLLDPENQSGIANLVSEMLMLGTQQKTAAEFEASVDQLGASIDTAVENDKTTIRISSLAKNYNATMALVSEMLLQPRWDLQEFELLKQRTITRLKQQSANPNAIAFNQFNQLLYPDDNRGNNPLGSVQHVAQITIDDLKQFHQKYYVPSLASLLVVGNVSQDTVTKSLQPLVSDWASSDIQLSTLAKPTSPDKSTLYFYDVPGAKQSVLQIGYSALKATEADYFAASVMNYRLGGGGFASQLTQQLREGKGYTYGIFSDFEGSNNFAEFRIQSNVRSNVTLESLALIKSIMAEYAENYAQQDLNTTQSFLTRSSARAFETANAKLSMLENISQYDMPVNYVSAQQSVVKEMDVERIKELARRYADPEKMIWLVVGDAESQLNRLEQLGFGQPVLLNPKTNN